MKFLALALCVLSALSAQARLGETEDELVQRFGDPETRPPFLPGTTHLVFFKNGFVIDVALLDGVSALEKYSMQRNPSNNPIEPDQVRALLAIESQGHEWTPVVTSTYNKWRRDDGAVAYSSETFSAMSKAYVDADAAYRRHQQPTLDGF